MDDVSARGRTGTYPTGVNGVAIETTICNRGSVEVDWFAPMDPRHPMIAFLIARESDGRLEQISDRSYLKHGFFALTSSQCTSCSPPGGPSGSRLGLGCSDTYSVFNNGDNYWLGPPDEISTVEAAPPPSISMLADWPRMVRLVFPVIVRDSVTLPVTTMVVPDEAALTAACTVGWSAGT